MITRVPSLLLNIRQLRGFLGTADAWPSNCVMDHVEGGQHASLRDHAKVVALRQINNVTRRWTGSLLVRFGRALTDAVPDHLQTTDELRDPVDGIAARDHGPPFARLRVPDHFDRRGPVPPPERLDHDLAGCVSPSKNAERIELPAQSASDLRVQRDPVPGIDPSVRFMG